MYVLQQIEVTFQKQSLKRLYSIMSTDVIKLSSNVIVPPFVDVEGRMERFLNQSYHDVRRKLCI